MPGSHDVNQVHRFTILHAFDLSNILVVHDEIVTDDDEGLLARSWPLCFQPIRRRFAPHRRTRRSALIEPAKPSQRAQKLAFAMQRHC